ncbi:hypothetical protein ABPG72_021346 [Tetrahymena utriculariae]
MDNFHRNLIYQDNREEKLDQFNLNSESFAQQLANTLQNENGQSNLNEKDSNFYLKERLKHPLIIKINNQQQNQNQGGYSNSLQISLPYFKLARNKSTDKNLQKGGEEEKTSDSFNFNQSNQSDQQQKTECNQNVFFDIEESNRTYASKITKIDHSQEIYGLENDQKSFKKRNNLMFMDYQRSTLSYENLQNIISFKNYIEKWQSQLQNTLIALQKHSNALKRYYIFTPSISISYIFWAFIYLPLELHWTFITNNVEFGLQCRARKYIQYLYSDEDNDKISSIKSLCNLSEYSQKEIQTDVYIKKLKKMQIFSEKFKDEILVELSLQMKEAFYCHDQLISQIEEYRQGQYFGLFTFLQGDNSRKVKYKSVGVSSVLKISYTSFVNVLKEYNLAYQKICFIRDEVRFFYKLMKINAYCDSCQQQNHLLEQCPYLFYEGKKQVIQRNYFRQQDNIFKNFRRQSTIKTQNSILNQKKVSELADKYYTQNIEYFSMWDFSDESEYESNEGPKDSIQQNSSRKFIEKQKKLRRIN